jgi:hypothetical protein
MTIAIGACLVLGPAASAWAGVPPPPNHAPFDEVQLNSGGFVRGEVQELVEGSHVVLRKKNGGKVQRYEWKDVRSVVRADPSALPEPEPKPDVEPEPKPDVEPEPKPDVEPEPEPDVEPEPEPDVEPEPEPEPDVEPEPEPSQAPSVDKPEITLTVNGDGPPVELRRADGEVICEGPCTLQIPRSDEEFFVELGDRQLGGRFTLSGQDRYGVDVKRPSAVMKWAGVALIPAAVIIGVGIGIIPAIHNVPRSSMIGYAVGGAAIGALGVAGGVTLIMFARGKVKVLPGIAAAPSQRGVQ